MTSSAGPTYRTIACVSLVSCLVPCTVASGQDDEPPETVQITGIVRDFMKVGENGGHVDFGNNPGNGMSRYAGNMAPVIGEDGRPVFTGNGAKITNQWRDAQNRQISYLMYDNFPAPQDTEGSFGQAGTGGITSDGSFGQWYKDVPVYNKSMPLSLTLFRQADGMYVFDDTMDPYYMDLGGFFPIDGQLLGDWDGSGNGNGGGSNSHNFYFTFEVHTQFQYDASTGQSFKFEGTDSVWLFIDGNLVNDIAGVHAAHDQYVALDRMGLVDGEWYQLDFFFAQRYTPQSSFRIETNIILDSLPISTISAVFD